MLIDATRNVIVIGSLAFSLFLRPTPSTTAVAPAGMTAPFEPVTASVTVAVKRSPTLFVFVQMREPERRLIVAPAGMRPVVLSRVPPLVTVLPLGVVRVAV